MTDIEKQLEILRSGNPPEDNWGLFGYDYPVSKASLVLLPVPWEPTASYGKGTKNTPNNIIPVSHQLDLFDLTYGNTFEKGISLCKSLKEDIEIFSELAEKAIDDKQAVNKLSDKVNECVYQKAISYLEKGQTLGVLGGDHSSPYGLIKALSDTRKSPFGILHIDAHHDLRKAYEGFTHSHASIMYNVLENCENVSKLCSIGIRDFSEGEFDYAKSKNVETYYWESIYEKLSLGESFDKICDQILNTLPNDIYISMDIDGLQSHYCPSTGTPVPGGFTYDQIVYLFKKITSSGKNVIGFDLCEVGAPEDNDWDLNVGARILYKLCSVSLNRAE